MSDPRNFDIELQELRQLSVDRLLAAEFIDVDAFGRLLAYLTNKAEIISADYVVSKQVLACLRDAQSAILSRAEYLDPVRAQIGMADKFAYLLDLIIQGERPSDRTLGVPRVF